MESISINQSINQYLFQTTMWTKYNFKKAVRVITSEMKGNNVLKLICAHCLAGTGPIKRGDNEVKLMMKHTIPAGVIYYLR